MNPRVTVLMTVYNGLPYLKEAIDSVLNQTFTDFEFLIIDDKSTDQSVALMESYRDPRIRLIKNAVNIGQNASLNKGLNEACGEFIARLDQDDVCLPQRIQRQVEAFDRDPALALLGTWAYSIDQQSRKKTEWKWAVPDFGVLVGLFLLGRNAIIHSAATYRRDIVNRVGGYDGSFGTASDYALWVTLILAGHRIAVLPNPLVMFRVHNNRQSATQPLAQWQAMARAHERLTGALAGQADVSAMGSILRLEGISRKPCLTYKEIASLLDSIDKLIDNASRVLKMPDSENSSFRRTMHRWLGPGVRLGARMKNMPPIIFVRRNGSSRARPGNPRARPVAKSF